MQTGEDTQFPGHPCHASSAENQCSCPCFVRFHHNSPYRLDLSRGDNLSTVSYHLGSGSTSPRANTRQSRSHCERPPMCEVVAHSRSHTKTLTPGGVHNVSG